MHAANTRCICAAVSGPAGARAEGCRGGNGSGGPRVRSSQARLNRAAFSPCPILPRCPRNPGCPGDDAGIAAGSQSPAKPSRPRDQQQLCTPSNAAKSAPRWRRARPTAGLDWKGPRLAVAEQQLAAIVRRHTSSSSDTIVARANID
eukprot:107658-Chlamydomonas_euryale.AAC.9